MHKSDNKRKISQRLSRLFLITEISKTSNKLHYRDQLNRIHSAALIREGGAYYEFLDKSAALIKAFTLVGLLYKLIRRWYEF